MAEHSIPSNNIVSSSDQWQKKSRGAVKLAAKTQDQQMGEFEEESTMDSYQKLQSLQAEVGRHQVVFAAQQYLHSVDASDDEAVIQQRIEELQKELKDISVKQTIKDCIQRSLQLQNTLEYSITYPDEQDPVVSNETDGIKSLICQTTELISNASRIKQEIQSMKPTLDELKQDCLDLEQENSQLMLKLKQLQENKQREKDCHKDDKAKSLKNNFDDMKEKLENFKNTFQGLIFGSAVNWAKDDALRDLVLELGTSVDELTKD